ncbi:MAG: DUF4363 family protein [Clostridia bacterium]|nr:DUF4363 family protein [Clostridia bacterium]
MKRVITAVIMLAFAITISSANTYLIDKKINNIDKAVESIISNPEKNKINTVLTEWKSTKTFLKFVTAHESVNEIDTLFDALKRSDNNDNTRNICSEIRKQLEILEKSEKPSSENIL